MTIFSKRKGKWKNKILAEGPKEAMVISQLEGYPEPNMDFDKFPVDMTLPEKLTFKSALKRAVWLSERCIYNLLIKDNSIEAN